MPRISYSPLEYGSRKRYEAILETLPKFQQKILREFELKNLEEFESFKSVERKNKALYDVAEKLNELNDSIESIKQHYYENKYNINFNDVYQSISAAKNSMESALTGLFKAHGYEASNLLAEALTPQLKVFFEVLKHPPQNVVGPNKSHLTKAKITALDLINNLSYQNKKLQKPFITNFITNFDAAKIFLTG